MLPSTSITRPLTKSDFPHSVITSGATTSKTKPAPLSNAKPVTSNIPKPVIGEPTRSKPNNVMTKPEPSSQIFKVI